MSSSPDDARDVLRDGQLCYVSATTEQGPHVTPVVFVFDGETVWATTARGTAKARAWRADPTAAGLVRHGEHAVAFRGRVTEYDVLDPDTWGVGLRRAPELMRASARFTVKNARYFAGYARDAGRLPFSWMPPARMVISIDLEAGALLDLKDGRVEERWGRFASRTRGRAGFTAAGASVISDRGVYGSLRRSLGTSGRGALGVTGSAGPLVLPVSWARAASERAYYAVLPRPFLALAGAGSTPRAALVIDRASMWRAAKMEGILLQGEGEIFLMRDVRTGGEELLNRVRRIGPLPSDGAVVRLRPDRAVWWRGWSSDTVNRR
jgi:hypothetical protein